MAPSHLNGTGMAGVQSDHLVTSGTLPSIPKVEYFKFAPTSTRFYRVMALAADLGCSWQDVIREAIDFYLKYKSTKKT